MSWCSHSTSVNHCWEACCLLNWTIMLSCENMSCLDIAEYTCCICVFARGECLAIRSNHSTAGWWIRCPVSITNGRNLVVDWSSAAMSSLYFLIFCAYLCAAAAPGWRCVWWVSTMCLVDGQTIAMSNKYLVPANVTARSARRSSFPIGGSLAMPVVPSTFCSSRARQSRILSWRTVRNRLLPVSLQVSACKGSSCNLYNYTAVLFRDRGIAASVVAITVEHQISDVKGIQTCRLWLCSGESATRQARFQS